MPGVVTPNNDKSNVSSKPFYRFPYMYYNKYGYYKEDLKKTDPTHLPKTYPCMS